MGWPFNEGEQRANSATVVRTIHSPDYADMANPLHKLVLPLLLIGHPVRAERLPVPPIPPTRSLAVKPVQVPHRGSPSSAKAVLSRRTPIPQASAHLATPAPMPDR